MRPAANPSDSSIAGPSRYTPYTTTPQCTTTKARPAPSSGSQNQRPKTGCLTCRLRKKRCDETKPSCATCERLGIQCLGYDRDRPEWLRGDANQAKAKEDLKKQVKSSRASRIKDLKQTNGQRRSASSSSSPEVIIELSRDDQSQQPPIPSVFAPPIPQANLPAPWDQPVKQVATAYTATTAVQDVYNFIFGTTPPTSDPLMQQPSPTMDNSLLSYYGPTPAFDPSTPPDLTYVHHYLDVVLPLQFRLGVKGMTEVIAPLVFSDPDVLAGATSLAALNRSANRTSLLPTLGWQDPSVSVDPDQTMAVVNHRASVQKVFASKPGDMANERTIIPTLFALSFYLFLGGTASDWAPLLGYLRLSLAAAFAASPEVMEGQLSASASSPWQRYRPLIGGMVWMDIVGSVIQNRATSILPVYRSLLGHRPGWAGAKPVKLNMDRVMGCDDTTFLAIAETVALSEWRDQQEADGSLSYAELIKRGAAIEKILSERLWREDIQRERSPVDFADEMSLIHHMAEVWYAAAKVLLNSVVHGPFPKVKEVAMAVQETATALSQLNVNTHNFEVNRALIFPITVAGCHCDTPAEQAFFRDHFAILGPEAAAFGNSRQALLLLEEVWRRRGEAERGARICWRQTMRDMGWAQGIFLI